MYSLPGWLCNTVFSNAPCPTDRTGCADSAKNCYVSSGMECCALGRNGRPLQCFADTVISAAPWSWAFRSASVRREAGWNNLGLQHFTLNFVLFRLSFGLRLVMKTQQLAEECNTGTAFVVCVGSQSPGVPHSGESQNGCGACLRNRVSRNAASNLSGQ